jgi:uncharacterized protein
MPEAVRFVFFNERGLRAGWRLAIFVLIFGLLSSALLVSLRLLGHHPGVPGRLTSQLVVLNDGPTFLLLLLATWIMSRIERRPMGVYGLPLKEQPVLSRLVTGYVFWGFLALSICLLTLHLLGAFEFGGLALHGAQIWLYGAQWCFAFLLVGFTEEYLLRGYALYTLADGIGFWPATIVLGVLFGLGHAANPGETRIGVIATVVFALFASVTLRLTGNLWLAVGAHAGWDWGQSFFYGVSDSGLMAEGHLFNSHPSTTAPVWLTGGSVGPEGSLVALILLLVMMLLVYLIYRKRREPALVIRAAGGEPQLPV